MEAAATPSAIPASPSSPTACWSTGWRSTTRRSSSSCARGSRRVTIPRAVVADALEIGARVLNREQTGANVEFVKAELEKTARESQAEFAERSRAVAEVFDRKFDEAFGPETGHVARVLTKHFGDESSVAVQNQLKAALTEAMGVMRDDLRKQFTADSDDNPFAVFQRAWLGAMKQTSDQQHARLREMSERMQGLVVELERARAEKEKAEAVAQEAERGTAKGRSFEEAVYAALDEIAVAPGRRLRRGRGPQGRHRQDRRRRGGDRGLHRPGPRARRVRGEGVAAVEAEGDRGARPRALRAPGRLRGARRARRGADPGQDAPAARVRRGQARRLLRPRGGLGALARGRLLAGAGARADGPRRGRGDRRIGDPRGDRARERRHGRRAADQAADDQREDVDRQKHGDPRRDGRRRARAAHARGAAAGRGRRRLGGAEGFPPEGAPPQAALRAPCGRRPRPSVRDEERLPRAATIAAGHGRAWCASRSRPSPAPSSCPSSRSPARPRGSSPRSRCGGRRRCRSAPPAGSARALPRR